MLSVPKDTFVSDLYAFMDRIGQPITKMPSLGYQELDLHRLFHAVISRGGMDEVTRKQEWKLVYQDLEIPTMSTSASYNTRTNYKKYLYLYELDRCDWGEERPADAALPKFAVGDYVRIESSTYEGQVFYAQVRGPSCQLSFLIRQLPFPDCKVPLPQPHKHVLCPLQRLVDEPR